MDMSSEPQDALTSINPVKNNIWLGFWHKIDAETRLTKLNITCLLGSSESKPWSQLDPCGSDHSVWSRGFVFFCNSFVTSCRWLFSESSSEFCVSSLAVIFRSVLIESLKTNSASLLIILAHGSNLFAVVFVAEAILIKKDLNAPQACSANKVRKHIFPLSWCILLHPICLAFLCSPFAFQEHFFLRAPACVEPAAATAGSSAIPFIQGHHFSLSTAQRAWTRADACCFAASKGMNNGTRERTPKVPRTNTMRIQARLHRTNATCLRI